MPDVTRLGGLTAILLAVLAGCGQGPDAEPDGPAAAATSLTISVVADEGAEPREMLLECDPVGGDHPNAEAACAALADAAPAIFDPVPADQMCTMIFGGPQVATVTGTYDGEPVDAQFSRSNGCEIGRWDALGTEVFDVPLQ